MRRTWLLAAVVDNEKDDFLAAVVDNEKDDFLAAVVDIEEDMTSRGHDF